MKKVQYTINRIEAIKEHKSQYMRLIKEYFEAKEKLLKCLRKRRYLHEKLGYDLFYDRPEFVPIIEERKKRYCN